jgi:16S rRNA A1518/A1519 N6-dimethyltransferase RsmA/KsgA/DIM1 with predicted DNA glycosylase/AP lyase activity
MDFNIKKNFWFDYLILMFQKEVADRIIAKFNTKIMEDYQFYLIGN